MDWGKEIANYLKMWANNNKPSELVDASSKSMKVHLCLRKGDGRRVFIVSALFIISKLKSIPVDQSYIEEDNEAPIAHLA